jgi:hypothetical protein
VKPFREKGIPAVLQIEDMAGDFNRYYHTSGDTAGHMDQAYWVAQIKALVASMAQFAGPVTDHGVTRHICLPLVADHWGD